MARLVSAWTEKDRTFLVQREGDDVRVRSVPARWSLFVTGLDESDRAAATRDRRVVGLRHEGGYTRIDCRNRWARNDIQEILEEAARRAAAPVEVLEADVSPVTRLLSDVPSLEVHEEPRLAYFDLETDSRRSFSEMRAGKARILSWALVGDDGRRAEGLLEADTDAAEVALLRDFFDAVEGYDCLLAWNGSGFDFEVLQSRCTELKVRRRGDREIPWHRWTWLDHMQVFKKYNMHSDDSGEAKQSFRLDHVASYLLGEGKHDFDASRTWEAWEAGGEERARLMRYNVQDTALLPRIEEKTGFLALHLAVCSICRIFPDTLSLNATAQGDGFLLRLGDEHGYRWPTRRRFDEDRFPKFKGAFVMEPTRLGAVDDVHVCDFAGLYPSIMRTWNMSPDTKLPAPEGWNPDRGPTVRPGVCQLPNRGTWFRTDRDGMFRSALDRLVAKRGEYQAEMKRETPGTPAHARAKRLQGAFKIVANSFYGITGSPWSRFFDVEIAEGVTQTGRWLLENVIGEAKLRDLDPFYGDTDSVFISGDAGAMRKLVSDMNASWAERLAPWGIRDRHHVDLDFEKTFRRIVIVSAKRYAGRYRMYKGQAASSDAAPEVKGLEFKRGDTIRLAREMQSEVVGMLLDSEDLPSPGEIRQVLDRWRARVLEEPFELADVVMSQSLSKRVEDYVEGYATDRCMTPGCGHDFGGTGPTGAAECPACKAPRPTLSVPAHVRVAKLLAERGEPLGEGDRVSYVVVGSSGTLEVIPSSDPDALERADRIYYWERRIYPATARVLENVYPGIHWGESRVERKQRVLEMQGQTRIDFGSGPPRPRRKKAEGGTPRRRRKKAGIVLTLSGNGKSRRLVLEAVKAAIEAHPGPAPVKLRLMVPVDGTAAVVEMGTGLCIARNREARVALERLLSEAGDEVTGF